MEYSAQALASVVNGEIKGNPDVTVSEFSKIEEAAPGTLTFLANPKYSKYLFTTKASIVLISRDLVPDKEVAPTLIIVDNAYEALAVLLEFYQKHQQQLKGKEKPLFVHKTARIGKNVYLGSFSYIAKNAVIEDDVKIYPHVYIGENVRIGSGTIIYPGVKIYYDTVIGKNCIIHAGTVIGADGFGFAPQEDGTFKKIAQIGNVIIEDDVEIGANSAIDRATMGSTVIKKGVKLDNFVHIAHNVVVGEHSAIAAQAGISGSAKIGSHTMIGGQVGVVGHIKIGSNVKIVPKSAITSSVPDNQVIGGIPAVPRRDFLKNLIVSKKLHQLYEDIEKLKKELNELKNKK